MKKKLIIAAVCSLVLGYILPSCSFTFTFNQNVTPTPTPTHIAVNVLTPTPTHVVRPCVPGVNIPLIPPAKYHGPSFSYLRPGTKFIYNDITYVLVAGAQGRLWGMMSGHQVLLYAPASAYHC